MTLALFFDPPLPRNEDDGSDKTRRRFARARSVSASTVPPEHPDRAAIDALRAGTYSAFESLYTEHAPAVYEFAQAYVPADAAHDVVQDVFLSLWRRKETIVVNTGLRSYLFGAARLRALQYRRNTRTGELAETRMVPDALPPPKDPAERAELRAAVAHALMTLPGRTRELLALRWVYDMSYTEAAAVLGVSPEAAKKLGRRAEIGLAPLLERFRA
jgi:RNA polymerase sigma-70 factor (ECF subfamily)